MQHNILFNSIELGEALVIKNRIIMAPLTRCMADDNQAPTEDSATYYSKRADTGFIITEATDISPAAQGYPNTPGLYSDVQIEAWKRVTQRVHENNGKIFAQIWHTGRLAHEYFHGQQPMGPSAIGIEGTVPRMRELAYSTPREMTKADIAQVISEFRTAAANAKKAGFDGVEIHGANGYLIDQFLHYDANQRADEYGGTPENMSRFLLAIIEEVKKEIRHVGVRLSPVAYFNMNYDQRDVAVFDYLLNKLNDYHLTYVHTGIFEDAHNDHLNGTVTQYIRRHYRGTVIANGGYSPKTAAQAIENGDADLVAIGRPMIANHDYVEKVKNQHPLNEYKESMLAELV